MQPGADPIDFKAHLYVDANFPFANATNVYACPFWIKTLLKEKYNLSTVLKVIKYFNHKKYHPCYLEDDIENDVDLEAYTDYEIHLLKENWQQNNQKHHLKKLTLRADTDEEIEV